MMQVPEESKPLSPVQKTLLAGLALLYAVLIILWIANNMNRPILGIGSVEGFNRMPAPVAATAPMTWRFAPGLGHMAVLHEVSPPAAASRIERVREIEAGANGAKVYLVQYLSDSTVVYGVLGLPGSTPAPAVVVCHPSDTPYQSGLHTQDTVKHLAEQGIVAFAPDYRGWGRSGGQRGNEVKDVLNALASLRADEAVNPAKLGLVGYSMGGGIAARAAAVDSGLQALVLYYAQMFGTVEELQAGLRYGQFEQGSGVQQLLQEGKQQGADAAELEYSLRMISPIYHLYDFGGRVAIFHGAQDQVVSPRQSAGLEQELLRFGKRVELTTYPDLSHAFANSIENESKEKFTEFLKATLLN